MQIPLCAPYGVYLYMLTIIASAYELYVDMSSDEPTVTKVGSSQSDSPGETTQTSKAARFKNTFSQKDVKVHFVGAWYVKSVLAWMSRPRDSDKMPGIQFRRLELHEGSTCSRRLLKG